MGTNIVCGVIRGHCRVNFGGVAVLGYFFPRRVIIALRLRYHHCGRGGHDEDGTMITNYSDFWDFYVREHSKPMTRVLHFIGTSLGLLLLVWFVSRGMWIYIPMCLVTGYAFAWFAHFVVEKNKPATFQYPFWSFISDYKMMWYMLTGRMDAEVERVSRSL